MSGDLCGAISTQPSAMPCWIRRFSCETAQSIKKKNENARRKKLLQCSEPECAALNACEKDFELNRERKISAVTFLSRKFDTLREKQKQLREASAHSDKVRDILSAARWRPRISSRRPCSRPKIIYSPNGIGSQHVEIVPSRQRRPLGSHLNFSTGSGIADWCCKSSKVHSLDYPFL